ncbi:CSG1/SUR1-like protein [Coniosporium tulheliwenetii]|uniref:CSG1/SUR1-like protein n=1 Tax=Coniosporium tulheliwenetii TaxID=3383036 RepID=A0ACC2Z5I6_9PEZI|nr:CSG1/SUR1-like protein [Cladosporium sp. JES 115]
MRKGVLFFLVFNLFVVALLVHSVWSLLMLLVVDGSEDAISRAELPAPGSDTIGDRPQLIPKIIHQTYINDSIPLVWQEAQKSCMDLHSDYEYKMWTDKKARAFVAAEYPWFLETFDGYTHPIQRADAIRYFVLAHYGGIYIDLDDGCNRRLDPLLAYPAWVRRTVPTGISNDAMGAVPRHPFFLRVIDELPKYDRNWLLPYITVMGSTGPLFLSVVWRRYNTEGLGRDGGRVRVLFPDEYNNHPWSFFIHHLGNSWHEKDVQFIFWMGRHWVFLVVAGFATAGVVFAVFWWGYGTFLSSGRLRGPPLRQRLRWFSRRRRRRTSSAAESELELLSRDHTKV